MSAMTYAPTQRGSRTLLRAAFAAREAEVGRVRRMVAVTLAYWGLDGLSEPAVLCTSELASNAVVHGDGPGFDLTLSYTYGDRELIVAVRDSSSGALPALQHPSPTAENGRGMLLVSQIATRWGVTVHRDGTKSTWASLTAPDAGDEIS